MTSITRRHVLMAGAALALPAVVRGQAPIRLKCGNIMPADHPVNVRLREASAKIKQESRGRIEIEVYPASQLGTDADMLAQVRSGGIDFFLQSGLILATLVPVAAINGIGFAFRDYQKVWSAMDGALGKHVIGAFAKANLVAFDKMWDNGFRQVLSSSRPIRSPDDLKAFKIRVPPSPLWTAMFKAIGAAPVSIPWGETYSAMQTKVADGLENPLAGIYYAKMHEVGKFVSNTQHMWDGFWFVANRRSFEALTASDRDLVTKHINQAALQERADVARLNNELRSKLSGGGIQFIDVQPEAFRQKLQASGFYGEWARRMGPQAWGLLESVVGRLT